MKNSTILFYSHFAIIIVSGFLISVSYLMPEAIPTSDLVILYSIQAFAIFLLLKMHIMAKKEKEQLNNNNDEVSQ
ncbi:hypothetical protein [Pseudomonas saponiphila]|uniref:hypothetical protein n=1 Tax=Pseudomonas saponiphila TaxID=556534 RepID=UPI00223F415F|nr:hypothetical protein [Pseudomonas saponiphila]